MKLQAVKREFLRNVTASGRSLKTLSLHDGVDLMLDFYQKEHVVGCAIDQDGDMLLYQWGTYNWGKGEVFEFNITRQLIVEEDEDENIWQLSLIFEFKLAEALQHIGQGNHWYHDLDQVETFRRAITESVAFLQLAHAVPIKARLSFEIAG